MFVPQAEVLWSHDKGLEALQDLCVYMFVPQAEVPQSHDKGLEVLQDLCHMTADSYLNTMVVIMYGIDFLSTGSYEI